MASAGRGLGGLGAAVVSSFTDSSAVTEPEFGDAGTTATFAAGEGKSLPTGAGISAEFLFARACQIIPAPSATIPNTTIAATHPTRLILGDGGTFETSGAALTVFPIV